MVQIVIGRFLAVRERFLETPGFSRGREVGCFKILGTISTDLLSAAAWQGLIILENACLCLNQNNPGSSTTLEIGIRTSAHAHFVGPSFCFAILHSQKNVLYCVESSLTSRVVHFSSGILLGAARPVAVDGPRSGVCHTTLPKRSCRNHIHVGFVLSKRVTKMEHKGLRTGTAHTRSSHGHARNVVLVLGEGTMVLFLCSPLEILEPPWTYELLGSPIM